MSSQLPFEEESRHLPPHQAEPDCFGEDTTNRIAYELSRYARNRISILTNYPRGRERDHKLYVLGSSTFGTDHPSFR